MPTRLSLKNFLITLSLMLFLPPVFASAPMQVGAAPTLSAVANVYGQPFVNPHTDSSPDGPHLVFAHYQLTAKDYGGTDAAHYALDVQEAARCGLDGFAIDIGGQPDADADMTQMLLAADQYNAAHRGTSNAAGVRNFLILFQPDFSQSYPESPPVLADALTRYSAHPSYYRYHGRPWFGTYTGEGGGDRTIKDVFGNTLKLLRSQTPAINPYFCPDFNIYGPDGPAVYTPLTGTALTQRFVSNVLAGMADAAWSYGTGGSPSLASSSGIPGAEAYSSQLRTAGMQWMGSVIPQYIGLGHHSSDGYRSYTEMYGGEHLDHQWQSIFLNQHAFWVQMVTWNDMDEGSGMTNAASAQPAVWGYFTHGINQPPFNTATYYNEMLTYYPSKLGLQAENLYWVQWYKTGRQPQALNDNLFVSYCPQLGAMQATNDPFGGIGPYYTETGTSTTRPDFYYITTVDQYQDVLTVTVDGAVVYSQQVPAGLNHVRVPSVTGTPTFTLLRNGNTTVSLVGRAIETTALTYDWYYYTATASSPLPN